MDQYAIYEENFDRLQKKITTIANKCRKFGCEFKFEVVGSEIRKVTDDEGNQRNCRFILVEAEGTAKLNNWEFIASIEHKEGGNIIRTFNKDAEIPTRYFTSDPICEHCNSKRRRNKTCLVRNTVTGEWKQVGLSCLKDFTCGLSAEDVTRYISFFDNLIEGEAPYSGSWGKPYWYISEYLPYVAECIKRFGYFNSCGNYPTSTRAFTYFEVRALNRKFMGSESIEKEMLDCKFEVTEESKKLAEETINWCKHLSNETDPYMHNLEVIFSTITSQEVSLDSLLPQSRPICVIKISKTRSVKKLLKEQRLLRSLLISIMKVTKYSLKSSISGTSLLLITCMEPLIFTSLKTKKVMFTLGSLLLVVMKRK